MNAGDARLVEQLKASLDRHERLEAEWTCDAVGEKYHQDALGKFVVDHPHDVQKVVCVTAELVREADNHYDEEAIRVVVDGEKIGCLPKMIPEYHRAALLLLLRNGIRL